MLSIGSRGDAVAQLQQWLNLAMQGQPPIAVDGAFGPQTRGRVMAFQGGNGLAQDGVAGPLTLGLLEEVLRLLGLLPPTPQPAGAVRSINTEILGMNGPNNLIEQIFPPIQLINPSTYQVNVQSNRFRFTPAPLAVGRLGIFAARKNNAERALILSLPRSVNPSTLIICITQGFAQAHATLDPLHWENPLSRPFIEFCLLKHVINRWGAQTLAARRDIAFLYIVRAKQGAELGPFAADGDFVVQVLNELVALTGNAFSFGRVEAFTFSSGIHDFNRFVGSISGKLNVAAIYSIDPAGAHGAAAPQGVKRRQFLSGQTGGPRAGFEFVPMDRWVNESHFERRTTFKNPWPFNYMHNHCMPLYILNLALQG